MFAKVKLKLQLNVFTLHSLFFTFLLSLFSFALYFNLLYLQLPVIFSIPSFYFLLIFNPVLCISQFPIFLFSLHPLLLWWENDCLSTNAILIYFITQVKKGRLFHHCSLSAHADQSRNNNDDFVIFLDRITRKPFNINLSFRVVVEWAVHAEPQ